MNYELAKELKDAGFTKGNIAAEMMEGEKETYYPTLSELIEACGEEFEGVFKEIDGWSASADKIDGYKDYEGRGSTPEEAVARLWLALTSRGKR